MSMPILGEDAIRNRVSGSSISQGRPYFEGGALSPMRREGTTVRALHEQQRDAADWSRCITALRERNRQLSALKDELQRAGL